ncbi:MATE family efflux transporter [Anaerobacillus isosaccharinicus]|uniref:MATE family efflux transporter n=2 Tax=Anaerobacillus isosaccharinicus TaxID=1532552 RepID=A0A7S7LCW4_9BACI|nr:MATE family efflux transporter [Anaerobacillus isosaccharinicus]
MLRILQTPVEIFDMAQTYLMIFFSGLLFIGGYNYLSAILRGLGNSKTPLYFLITFIPFSFMFIITGVLRGAGDMLWGLILTAASLWAVRVPAVYILANYFGTDGIWYGMALSFVLAFVITGVYYLSGNWKKKALVKQNMSNNNKTQYEDKKKISVSH